MQASAPPVPIEIAPATVRSARTRLMSALTVEDRYSKT